MAAPLSPLAALYSTASEKEASADVEFWTCETSASIVEKAGWKFPPLVQWSNALSEKDAIHFIQNPPERDKRTLLSRNRFRILLVRYRGDGGEALYKQKPLIDAARAGGWIDERFDSFASNSTAGSGVVEGPDGIRLLAHTPKDDGRPFFSVALAYRPTEAHRHDADWECLVFVRPAAELWDNGVEPLLRRDPFPHDYSYPLLPDLMVLPVALLRWQVQHIVAELSGVKDELVERGRRLLLGEHVGGFKSVRDHFFVLRRRVLILRRRWQFANELAETLTEAFGILARRCSSDDEEVTYSPTLIARVASQQTILKSAIHDMDAADSSIESQRKLVDDQARTAITQRENMSMKIIQMVTLGFLPATFVATFFGMSIFDWHAGQARDDHAIVSPWLWLYFVVSLALTLVVAIIWKVMSKREERRQAKAWSKED